MRYRIFLLSLVALLLIGCATPLQPNQVLVTFNSEPPGAMIYDGTKAWGVAPVELVFTGNQSDMKNGVINHDGVFAMWSSGAKSQAGVHILLSNSNRQSLTFSRPSNAPGLNIDLAFAAKLKQIAAQEDAAMAANNAAFWQTLNSRKPIYTDCSKFGNSVSCVSQ